MTAHSNGIATPIRSRDLPQHGPWLYPNRNQETGQAFRWLLIDVQAAIAFPVLDRLAGFLGRFGK